MTFRIASTQPISHRPGPKRARSRLALRHAVGSSRRCEPTPVRLGPQWWAGRCDALYPVPLRETAQ